MHSLMRSLYEHWLASLTGKTYVLTLLTTLVCCLDSYALPDAPADDIQVPSHLLLQLTRTDRGPSFPLEVATRLLDLVSIQTHSALRSTSLRWQWRWRLWRVCFLLSWWEVCRWLCLPPHHRKSILTNILTSIQTFNVLL
eukprot:m.105331 g.105331  ORF g.105331 m.105331 type:complete len:140 (+) comp13278_c1_seq3:109-528(+)